MSSSFGEIFRVTTFGESHGPALGAVLEGVPSGLPIDTAFIQAELDKRRPGVSPVSTQRREPDTVEVLSGVYEGRAAGTPLALLIRNCDPHSADYSALAHVFRPGHADWGYFAKYGFRDPRGGGRASGRETAARVAAGAVAKIFLNTLGVRILAWAEEIAGIRAEDFSEEEIACNSVRSPDARAAAQMEQAILRAREEKDSVGGVICCRISGVPAGWGEPVFDKLDALLGHAMLSIGGVKGIAFGSGFDSARMHGSENNDPRTPAGFLSNHAGGILGGISTGQEILFRLAVKPTPSIAREQQSVDEANAPVSLSVTGRHDPCLVPRIVPVAEAMAALVLADCALRARCGRL